MLELKVRFNINVVFILWGYINMININIFTTKKGIKNFFKQLDVSPSDLLSIGNGYYYMVSTEILKQNCIMHIADKYDLDYNNYVESIFIEGFVVYTFY